MILYFVLFFPGIYSSGFASGLVKLTEIIPFDLFGELCRTFTYTIPAFALLWYVIPDNKGFSSLQKQKIKKEDLLPFAFGLPGLILIGLGISFLISLLAENQILTPPQKIEGPANVWAWVAVIISCIGTGYLEESYFRYYLLTKLESQLPAATRRILLSSILFSLCHVYEGPWGIINALLAGLLLSVLFIRYRSLHGIAWAHGGYNIFVYAMGPISS